MGNFFFFCVQKGKDMSNVEGGLKKKRGEQAKS